MLTVSTQKWFVKLRRPEQIASSNSAPVPTASAGGPDSNGIGLLIKVAEKLLDARLRCLVTFGLPSQPRTWAPLTTSSSRTGQAPAHLARGGVGDRAAHSAAPAGRAPVDPAPGRAALRHPVRPALRSARRRRFVPSEASPNTGRHSAPRSLPQQSLTLPAHWPYSSRQHSRKALTKEGLHHSIHRCHRTAGPHGSQPQNPGHQG